MSQSKVRINHPIENGIAKVPVVMQMEALECGAACLTMILGYYNKWIPLEQVRVDCGVSRDGSNAKNVLKAARNYGLIAKGFKLEPDALREKGSFPCIIHWNFNHFVVCNGFKGNKVSLNDPAKGNYTVPIEVFDESFTGICLMFQPGDDFVPSGKRKNVWLFAKSRLKGTGSAVAFTVLTLIISSLIGIINPAFSRIFLDKLLTYENPQWIMPFFILLGSVGLIQIIITWLSTVYMLRINGKMAIYGNTSYMWKVLRLPMEFFSQRMAGDIQQRQQSNGDISNQLVETIAPLFINSAMMLFYLAVMVRYSIVLTCIGLGSMILNSILSGFISKKRVNITRIAMRDEGKLAGTTIAGIEMIETIKSSGAENGYFEKWSGYQASVNTQQVRFEKLNQYFGMIPYFITSVSDIAVMILGVYFAIKGQFTIGMIMAFQGFMTSFMTPAMSTIESGQVMQEMLTEMERVDDVMSYPSDFPEDREDMDDDAEYEKLSGNLELKNVTFGYSRLSEPLLEDFSMSLKQGQSIAFVGGSGCGKSTLTKLISGLYKPWQGEILFDGKAISEIDRSVFTGSLAVVDQDIILFEDTIADNIRMWDQSIADFEVIMAARDAQLHEDIMQRDGGYNYKLLEGGKDLSGGQRQRIEIARVLAQDPTIIIMDEATSALDAKTEYDVVKAIKDRGITCIVVAHRLSTIRDCDEIVVLDNGRVVERGTHQELFAKGGYYTELVSNE